MSRTAVLLLVPTFVLAACASSPQSQQLASRECKVVPGTFVDVPKKNPTPAEQAEAQLKLQRFAYERGGYGVGTNMPAEAVRDCY
jgi:hypothetical protein